MLMLTAIKAITIIIVIIWNLCFIFRKYKDYARLSIWRLTSGECERFMAMVGGKPRPGTGFHKRGRGTSKTPVFGIVQRNGNIHRRVVADVSAKTLKSAIRECVDNRARIITDEHLAYRGIGKEFKGGHATVNHGTREYVRGDIFTNTAESSFALIKRGLTGIYHAVSKKHLHRYLGEYDFRWNTRQMNDGDRTVLAIKGASGKRLTGKDALN
jgi:transposase-like protein